MRKVWSDEAWEDYMYWQTQDRKTLRKINELIKDDELLIASCREHYED